MSRSIHVERRLAGDDRPTLDLKETLLRVRLPARNGAL
jgi:hypothetical protein